MLNPMLRSRALLASAFLACLVPLSSVHAADLRVGGTGSATGLLRLLAEAFAKQSEAHLDVIPSLGSSGGLRAVADGILDVAVSARPLKPQEEKQGLAVALVARTPLVFATSHPKPNGLTVPDLVNAFASQRAAWSDGTQIRVILRPRSEADVELMGQLFPGLASAMEDARKRPDVPVAATDQDNADMAEQIPGSLVGTALTQLATEKRKLRAISIDGIEPTFENFERASYRYGKSLYFVLPAKPSPLAERFIVFLRSVEGQELLRQVFVIL